MPQGFVKPTNQILVDSYGQDVVREYEVGANATAAEMIPGACVIVDTLPDNVKEAGDEADSLVGVLEVSPTGGVTTAYAVGDQARVLKGHFKAQIRLKGGENVSVGTVLTSGDNGVFKIRAVGAMGAQGAPNAKALEASNVTTIAYILAEVNTEAIEAAAAA